MAAQKSYIQFLRRFKSLLTEAKTADVMSCHYVVEALQLNESYVTPIVELKYVQNVTVSMTSWSFNAVAKNA